MKQLLLSIILSVISASTLLANFSAFSGTGKQPYTLTGKDAQGVSAIYLFNSLSGAYLEYTSVNSSLTFYKYKQSSNDQVAIASTIISSTGNSTTYRIENIENGYGYHAGESKIAWIVDYPQYYPTINDVTFQINDADICDNYLSVVVNKAEPSLKYYTITGEGRDIRRKYLISYDNIKWNTDNLQYDNVPIEEEFVDGRRIKTPITNTRFTISDLYADHFGINISKTSDEEYQAVIPDAHIEYKIIVDGMEVDSIYQEEYSAPLEVKFYAHANEPAASFYEWLIFKGNDFANWVARFTNETDITYIFNEAGKYTVQLNVSDASGTCTATDQVDFNISESMLDIPNFFTPNGSPGYNDIFKVKHKSLVKFRATIFNRWGNKLYEWTNPDEGWDGKYKGKYVNPGVYFYVIEATGSEGKKYKKGGDINIVNGNNNVTGDTQP